MKDIKDLKTFLTYLDIEITDAEIHVLQEVLDQSKTVLDKGIKIHKFVESHIYGTRPNLIIVDDLETTLDIDLSKLEQLCFELPDPVCCDFDYSIENARKEHLKSCQPWKRKKKGKN